MCLINGLYDYIQLELVICVLKEERTTNYNEIRFVMKIIIYNQLWLKLKSHAH